MTAFTDSHILLRFVNIGSNGHQLYLDDIRVADSTSIVKTKDIILESRSKVFPNPTSDNVVIEIDKPDAQPIKLELMNTQGKIVKSEVKFSWDTHSVSVVNTGFTRWNLYVKHL